MCGNCTRQIGTPTYTQQQKEKLERLKSEAEAKDIQVQPFALDMHYAFYFYKVFAKYTIYQYAWHLFKQLVHLSDVVLNKFFLLKLIKAYILVRQAFDILTGKRTEKTVYISKNTTCFSCPKLEEETKRVWYYLWLKKKKKHYCGSSRFSTVNWNNRIVYLSCPLNKF